jgi:hypothetical protein
MPSKETARAARRCLLAAGWAVGEGADECGASAPATAPFGPSVSAASTLHTERRFHRFLRVSRGHRGRPVIRMRLPEARTLSVGFSPQHMP